MDHYDNRIPYFQKLQSISPTDSLIDILNELGEMKSQSYELSIGSKLIVLVGWFLLINLVFVGEL